MDNSATVKLNEMGIDKSQSENKAPLSSLGIFAAAPIMIGSWAAICFLGLVVSYGGPAAWNFIS